MTRDEFKLEQMKKKIKKCLEALTSLPTKKQYVALMLLVRSGLILKHSLKESARETRKDLTGLDPNRTEPANGADYYFNRDLFDDDVSTVGEKLNIANGLFRIVK